MNEMYLDIMEKSLSAYTDERIRDYIDEVKRDGLKEHGFPRLAVNIGILMAYGRRMELMDTFIEIMDICCEQMPKRKAANDFSVREVCCCLMLLEEKQIVDSTLLQKWKEKLSDFDPWKFYNVVADHSGKFVGNWALFAAVSEYMRGVYCGIDTSEFVDWQIPSQLSNLDCNDMYMDAEPELRPANPMVYDMVPRILFAFLLRAGYKGKYAERIEQVLDNTADITLKMQSVTGELAFGGRSNQFLNNDTMLCAYCELEAVRFKEKGDLQKAGEFKAAAKLAAENVVKYLELEPISHIKNRYDVATRFGCENYGYFNKYMITTASNLYMGALFADDGIQEVEFSNKKLGYVFSTSEQFHKTFLCADDYFAQIDTNADFRYDANGIGRIHKKGYPSALCLSVPFPAPKPNYLLEQDNKNGMSLCCYAKCGDKLLSGADKGVQYTLVDTKCNSNVNESAFAQATFQVAISADIKILQKLSLCENGIDITLSGEGDIGFMVPVFDFDGEKQTEITLTEGGISVEYYGGLCVYGFEGEIASDYEIYHNRNGRYRVYQIKTKHLHIVIKKA